MIAKAPSTSGRLGGPYARVLSAGSLGALGLAGTEVIAPLYAIASFHATAGMISLLLVAGSIPWLVISLPAGVWVDRSNKVTVLRWQYMVRALALLSIPAAYLAGWQSYAQLVVVELVVGITSVFITVSSTAVLPAIVQRDDLARANSQLSAGTSVGTLGGQAAGGLLVAWLGGALAYLFEAFTSIASALLMLSRSLTDSAPKQGDSSGSKEPFLPAVRRGLALTFGELAFRKLTVVGALVNLGEAMRYVALPLLAVRVLLFSPGWVGGLFVAATAGGILSSLAVPRLSRLLGTSRLWRWSTLLDGMTVIAAALVPMSTNGRAVFVVLIVIQAAFRMPTVIISSSTRQALCPPELIGRLSATSRVITWGVIPLGASAGGLLISLTSIRTGYLVAGCVALTAWLVTSSPSLRRVRDLESLDIHFQAA